MWYAGAAGAPTTFRPPRGENHGILLGNGAPGVYKLSMPVTSSPVAAGMKRLAIVPPNTPSRLT